MSRDTLPAVVSRLQAASCAEDFFAELDVAFDPIILRVARLHILKKMGEELSSESLAGLTDDEARSRLAGILTRAYRSFEVASPLKQRVFKVLRDRDPAAPPAHRKTAFVSFDELMATNLS
jgi:nitrogenase-stabilizing/protective protein